MDSYRGFEGEAESAYAPALDEPALERPPEVGFDERRMHVRAYNYWVSLLDGRTYPSIEDLDPASIEDFGPHSVLLDFSSDPHDPAIAFLGRELRDECALDPSIATIGQVPPRSLLSRLTDHYMQIIANGAPIGFEAEFVGSRGNETLYRGILMPLSADGESIGFVYGVINWKELADCETASDLAVQVDRAITAAPAPADSPAWADGPSANAEEPVAAERDDLTLSFWSEADEAVELAPAMLAADAGLADRLSVARESADAARACDQRSRAALYRALGYAWDFALAAEAAPEEFAELLDDAGIRVQARAPMTAVAKLVFGAGYDKTRLTEFAAALSWAQREAVGEGGLAACLEAFEGGLKGMVAAERRARRPAPRPDRAEEIRERLRTAPAFAQVEVDVADPDAEFVLLLARREANGRYGVVAPLSDEKLTRAAIRRTAA